MSGLLRLALLRRIAVVNFDGDIHVVGRLSFPGRVHFGNATFPVVWNQNKVLIFAVLVVLSEFFSLAWRICLNTTTKRSLSRHLTAKIGGLEDPKYNRAWGLPAELQTL